MIKKLLSIALLATAITVNAQSFTATYSFVATTTVSGSTDPTPPPTATGLTFGSFSAVGTSTANQSAGRFSFNGWPIATLSGSTSAVTYTDMGGAIDLNKYYEVILTPTSGYQVTLTSMDFTARRTSTAPRSFAVRGSVDSYSANLSASIVGTGTVITLAGTDEFWFSVDGNTNYFSGNTITFGTPYVNVTTPTSIRIYAWNSEANAGNFTIDDVTFNGSASVATGLASLNFDLNANFNVYPVPNNDGIVYIENKNAQELSSIEIVDVFGNVILSSKNETAAKIKLNLSEVSNGNYVVRINTTKGTTTKKLVIVK
jgi:hypothetical protein